MHKRLELRRAIAALAKRFPELKRGRLTGTDLREMDNPNVKTDRDDQQKIQKEDDWR